MFFKHLFFSIYTAITSATLQIVMQDTVFVNIPGTLTWTRSPGDPTQFLIFNRLRGTDSSNLPELPAVNTTDDVLQGTLDLTSVRVGVHQLEAWDPKNASNRYAIATFNVLPLPSGSTIASSTSRTASADPKPSECSSCPGPSGSSSPSTSTNPPTVTSPNRSTSSVNTAALAGGIVAGFLALAALILAIWMLCRRYKARRSQWADTQRANKEVINPFDLNANAPSVTQDNHRRLANDQQTLVGYSGERLNFSAGSAEELITRIQELERLIAQMAAGVPVSSGEEFTDVPPSYTEPGKRRAPYV